MALMKWLRMGLLGILITLFMVAARNGVSEEAKKENNQKAYARYIKTVETILSEIDKVDFALEGGADPKKSWEKLMANANKICQEKNLLGDIANIKRPVVSHALLDQTLLFYGKALGCLSINKDSRIARHLLITAKGFKETTRICLAKEDIIASKDCSICRGDGTIQCYWCTLEKAGICPNCNGKTCSSCDKTGVCPVCLGMSGIPCLVDTVIAKGPEDPNTGRINANECSAIAALRLLAYTEAIWLLQDCDGNGIKDYWTYDISCFHRMYRPDGQTKVSFIPINMALSDSKSADMKGGESPFGGVATIEPWTAISMTPKSGYFFQVMSTDENGKAYNQNAVGNTGIKAANSSKFAFVAYPAKYAETGVNTFIVNQEGTVYSCDCGSDATKIVLQWPGGNPSGVTGPGGENWKVAE
ncbi:MAG: DUF2950 family protein [Planctomycetota bacterium]